MDDREPSLFELADPEAEEQALQQAEADVAAGRVVPHAEVVRWLQSWGKADELPAPKPGQWQR
jgi:predicted transcriptional regulator